jgi:hypothetical protein
MISTTREKEKIMALKPRDARLALSSGYYALVTTHVF